MPHNCCVPLCKKKGYRAVTIDGKEVKVTYHNFPSESSTSRSKLRMQWICAIRQDVSKNFRPGRWMKICLLHFRETNFYNFYSGYRTLREDFALAIFLFNSAASGRKVEPARSSSASRRRSRCRPTSPSGSSLVICSEITNPATLLPSSTPESASL